MHKTCAHIAVVTSTVGAFERGVQNAGLDEVFTDGSTASAHVFHATAMHRAVGDTFKLVNHAVIPPRHTAGTKT